MALSGHRVLFVVEDRRPDSKRSSMFQKSGASSATTRQYGFCLSLVLSGKPHQGTTSEMNGGRVGSVGRGATKEKLRHNLRPWQQGLDCGLWVKCTNSREYSIWSISRVHDKGQLEQLKEGASEGFPLSLFKTLSKLYVRGSFIDGVFGSPGVGWGMAALWDCLCLLLNSTSG